MAPPCGGFSKARTTGYDISGTVTNGRKCGRFAIKVIRACIDAGVYFTVENPRQSAFWDSKALQSLLKHVDASVLGVSYCQFGAPYQKPTLFAGSLPGLTGLECKCTCGTHRHCLKGKSTVVKNGKPKSIWRTSLAAFYPPRLCRRLALIAETAARGASRLRVPQVAFDHAASRSLAVACGTKAPVRRLVPDCPSRYICPWDRSFNEWGT